MVLLDDQRRHVDVNGAYLRLLGYRREALIGLPIYDFVAGGPLITRAEFAAPVAAGRFTGAARLVCADGGHVAVQWGACAEIVTGRRLILFVALNTSRWGMRFRRRPAAEETPRPLSPRELEIVQLIADGSSGPEIAAEVQIAHETVRSHVRNAMDKVGARSRAHLVAKALGEGLVID